MYTLKPSTKAALERALGRSVREISMMDLPAEIRYVEERTKQPLRFSKVPDPRMSGRGNPYLVRRRLCTMEDIDTEIERLTKR